MSGRYAITGARIFDGDKWHDEAALLVSGDQVAGIVPQESLETGMTIVEAAGGMLAPGFVDLQVNGGGGLMINDRPDVETIRTICAAHAPFGTTALLVTLITDTEAQTRATVEAGIEAARLKVPGFLGLHLEGPHLSVSRKGAHDPALIRPMNDADEAALIAARERLPVLLTTVAPETVEPQRIEALARAGIVVSLGHSDASYRLAAAAARSRRDDGHASVQRDEPDRQPRAGAGGRGDRHRIALGRADRRRHSCRPGDHRHRIARQARAGTESSW